MKRWRCTICNYVHEGDTPPERCPICKAPASKFVLMPPTEDEVNARRLDELAREIAELKEKNKSQIMKLYDRFQNLIVKHHAHPISVHFPNGVMPVAVTFFVLYLILGIDAFATAGIFNLVFVILTLPIVLFAGYAEWVRKYNTAWTTLFKIKIAAAAVTSLTCLFNATWYIANPDVLSSSLAWLFILICIIMLGAAGIAGHLGGKLVFKD